MFGMFSSLAKATVGVVIDTPISIVYDAVNNGVMLSDDDWKTEKAIKRILKNIEDATDSD